MNTSVACITNTAVDMGIDGSMWNSWSKACSLVHESASVGDYDTWDFKPFIKRKFKNTTDSRHDKPVASNLLEQNFTMTRLDEAWAGDITYIRVGQKWLYLAVVIDLYSRRVVGWSMDKRMKAALVCDALKMALYNRSYPKGVIMHTDRGSQYCSKDYQKLIKKHGFLCSMSSKGNCYDNAVCESFFHTLKVELVYQRNYDTRD